jgi:hypothetical protein
MMIMLNCRQCQSWSAAIVPNALAKRGIADNRAK